MVPEGWELKELSELTDKISDGIHSTPKYAEHSTIHFVNGNNLKNGRIVITDSTKLVDESDALRHQRDISERTLLMSINGTIGNLACYRGERVVLGKSACFMNISPKADLDFIYFVLSDNRVQNFYTSELTGTTIRNLSLKTIKATKIPTPPIPEQKKIAQILSTWDNSITATERLLENSQQRKKALMQQLLTGKKRLPGFEGENAVSFFVREGYAKSKLGMLPNDWKVDVIKKHLWFQEGPGVRLSQFTDEGVKLFNGTNIQSNKIDLNNTRTHISKDEASGPYKHFLIDDGDLLIACSGISIDKFDEKIAFASLNHLPLCMNTSTMRFKEVSKGTVCINYFKYFLQSNLFKNQIRRQATGSAQLNFGPSHVGVCYVVIPPIKEQKAIANVLTTADQEIEALHKRLGHLKQEKKALMQQLLTGKRRVQVEDAA